MIKLSERVQLQKEKLDRILRAQEECKDEAGNLRSCYRHLYQTLVRDAAQAKGILEALTEVYTE